MPNGVLQFIINSYLEIPILIVVGMALTWIGRSHSTQAKKNYRQNRKSEKTYADSIEDLLILLPILFIPAPIFYLSSLVNQIPTITNIWYIIPLNFMLGVAWEFTINLLDFNTAN